MAKRLPSVKLVAVVGGSGAGKSWLIDRLLAFHGDAACRIQLDDFYRDLSHLPLGRRPYINFDAPAAIDWAEARRVLAACRAGRQPAMPRYDFVSLGVSRRRGWTLAPLVFVDGLWLLHRRWLRELFDLTIFLDVPKPVRCRRRLERDVVERGYTPAGVRLQLRERVLPQHARYVAPQRRHADLVLKQPYSAAAVAALAARLRPLLPGAGSPDAPDAEVFRRGLAAALRRGR